MVQTEMAVLFLLLMARPVLGAENRAQEKAARKACLTGDYAKGVAILADLFLADKNPVHVFNQGRCYEQSRRYENAIAQFEEFLRTTVGRATQEERGIAETHIAECREKLKKERIDSAVQSSPAGTSVEPNLSPPENPPLPVPTSPNLGEDQPAGKPAAQEHRWGMITAGIVTGAVGAGGIATGIVFNLKANKAAKDLETNIDAYPTSRNDAKDFKTYAWIGYSVGAACLTAGAILVAIGASRSSPSSSSEMAFAPTLGPGQIGAVMTRGF